jgi:positive regulator of sigma E activity
LRALAGRHGLLEVEVEAGRFRIGDEVRIRMPVEAVERAALWCYGAPVAGTLLGALFAAACVPAAGDAATVTGAALGLGLTYIALRRRTRRMGVAGAVRLELGDDAQDGATRG